MERPDAKDIVDLEFFLLHLKSVHEDERSDPSGDERTEWMHDVATGADGNQPGKCTVVGKTRVALADKNGDKYPSNHCQKRVYGNQAGYLVKVAGAHDVESEPPYRQHPGTKGQKGDVADRDRV